MKDELMDTRKEKIMVEKKDYYLVLMKVHQMDERTVGWKGYYLVGWRVEWLEEKKVETMVEHWVCDLDTRKAA